MSNTIARLLTMISPVIAEAEHPFPVYVMLFFTSLAIVAS